MCNLLAEASAVALRARPQNSVYYSLVLLFNLASLLLTIRATIVQGADSNTTPPLHGQILKARATGTALPMTCIKHAPKMSMPGA